MDAPPAPALKQLAHQDLRDPAQLYEALSVSAPIQHCRSLVPDRACLHRVANVQMGSSVLISQAGTPADFLVEHTPCLHLVVCFGGRLDLETAGGSLTLLPREAVLVPSGLRRSHGGHSLASFTLEPAAVAATAAAMAGSRPCRLPSPLPRLRPPGPSDLPPGSHHRHLPGLGARGRHPPGPG